MVEKSDEIWRVKHVRKFDEQKFNELIVAFIGKVLTAKRLEGKTLTNRSPFIKNSSDFSTVKILRYTVRNWVKALILTELSLDPVTYRMFRAKNY